MTTPRFGTDPKSGVNFSFGEKLLSTNGMNDILPWMRNLDLALERATAQNWVYTGAPGAGDARGATYDESLGLWVMTGVNGGNPTAYTSSDLQTWTSRTVAATLTPHFILSSGAGVVVLGGDQGGASANKIRESTDAITWTARSTSDSSADYPQCGVWDGSNSLFIIGFSGGSDKCETSPDGQTWTTRSMGAAYGGGVVDMATDGSGTTVAIFGSGTGSYKKSTDGTTWASGTFQGVGTPSMDRIAYAPGTGTWLAMESGAAMTTSDPTDGLPWTDAQTPTGATTFHGLVATGNIFICSYSTATQELIATSDDDGATWEVVYEYGTAFSAFATSLHYARHSNGGGQCLACSGGALELHGTLRINA